ncbi:hypothetical protein pmac_cds_189 [Pandoravirus macleodensis]|uniref:Uncharacterized protein n=1 Tax=Pandoravirus macleodensis TaxID=2107707 RepID=A0A2U7UEL0_9VIRU|nr:hypothetical protein pmac_cds_189 [Pandoravirus macleodensis]AVK76877.1 hypothetical protein pmac_cds_189 [Pandoravirus macleodensis]
MAARDRRHDDNRADASIARAHDDSVAYNNGSAHGQSGPSGEHAIGVEWLLNAASARLAANKGARCPLRVALAALGTDIEDRLVSTTDLRGPALWAARQAAIQLARSTPEVLCTLTMCDLCVSWSRALLASVKPRATAAAAANSTQLDFKALTASFSEASVAQKKTDDPSALYSVCVHNVGGGDDDDINGGYDDNDDNVGSNGDGDHVKADNVVEYCFANEATYVSYRYFLRRAWEGLAGVPPAWARPMPRDVCGWIESAMRMRDLCLTLPQHRLCLPPRRDGQGRGGVGSGETHVVYRQEGGRGGRLPPDGSTEWPRRSRSGAPVQPPLERPERHLVETDIAPPACEQQQQQQQQNRERANAHVVQTSRQGTMGRGQSSGVLPWVPPPHATLRR